MLDSAMALHPPPADTHSLLLFVEHADRDDSSYVTVTLFTRAAFARSRAEAVPSRPLATLGYTTNAVGVPLTLGKLIGENLRTSHLCHLTIETAPPGARVQSDKGLQGTSPVEWVLPVAPVHIVLTLENHLPRAHTIALEQPGRVHYTFELRRRSFVHSRFFPLALGAAALGGAGFALDRLFYTRYRELGEEDYHEQPDAFGRLFKQAQLFERISLGLGVTAGVFLGLSFLF